MKFHCNWCNKRRRLDPPEVGIGKTLERTPLVLDPADSYPEGHEPLIAPPAGEICHASEGKPTVSDITLCERGEEVAVPSTSPPRAFTFADLSEDVHEATLLCLWGNEAAAATTAAAPLFQRLLAENKLWRQFVCQEFPTHPNQHSEPTRELYRILHERQRCKALKWKQLQCSHRMGAREGSPGVFARHGYLFIFGGWGHGPERDLHVGKLSSPMQLRELRIQGRQSRPSYEMKVTVLDDDAGIPGRQLETSDEENDEVNEVATEKTEVIRAIVTGGYLHGGYHGESQDYSLLEIHISPDTGIRAECVRTGELPVGRSNHSATFIPPRVAGPKFPEGYLLVFAGNARGRATNSIDVLDLATWKWIDTCLHDPQGQQDMACCTTLPGDLDPVQPSARNSHSATLLQVPFLGDAVLVVGGGTGSSINGGPPRGGTDVTDSWWLSGLENAGPFTWTQAPQGSGLPIAAGRGHVACRLDGTGTVLTVGGGLPPRNMCVAFDLAKGGTTYGGECHQVEMATEAVPRPRAFGGGCALPGGSVLIYGGWHPRGGTYDDIWIGHADHSETQLFREVPHTAVQEAEEENDQLLRRMFGWQALGLRRAPWLEDSDGEDDLDEEDDDDEDSDAEDEEQQQHEREQVEHTSEGQREMEEGSEDDSSLPPGVGEHEDSEESGEEEERDSGNPQRGSIQRDAPESEDGPIEDEEAEQARMRRLRQADRSRMRGGFTD